LGQLKAKLAKLRRELIDPKSGGGGGGGGIGFDVARTGVASVGFVGFPSVGKVGVTSGSDCRGIHPTKVYSDDQAHRHTLRSQRNRIHDPYNGTRNLESPWCSNPNPRPAYVREFTPLCRGLISVQLELSKERTTVGVEVARSSQACPFPFPQNCVTYLHSFRTSRSDMQPNLHHPGRTQTPRRQESNRIRTRRLWDPIEQETPSDHRSEEGQGRHSHYEHRAAYEYRPR
jgi:hypothetical protein